MIASRLLDCDPWAFWIAWFCLGCVPPALIWQDCVDNPYRLCWIFPWLRSGPRSVEAPNLADLGCAASYFEAALEHCAIEHVRYQWRVYVPQVCMFHKVGIQSECEAEAYRK